MSVMQPEMLGVELARLIRRLILQMTTQAGSGHPTSSLSAVELMVGLFFGGGFRFDLSNPGYAGNDRLIFSKGHAAPLLYAFWAAAGAVSFEELLSLRSFASPLEGHPVPGFPYAEAATGSLGQGLAIGVGTALHAQYVARVPSRTWVLLGDGEMAEGSQWESLQLAAQYRLHSLSGILDVNRLGQQGQTMYGHDLEAYCARIRAFGWETITVDGHRLEQISVAYARAVENTGQPTMVIARTIKGKGVSFVEDVNGRHGKALSPEELERALTEIGEVDTSLRGSFHRPPAAAPIHRIPAPVPDPVYDPDQPVATRTAFGSALARLYPQYPGLVVLDGDVSDSTRVKTFADAYPDRFFQMYIAEQNMVGAALGLARRGALPCVATFAAFLSRAHDQIRMAQYSDAHIVFCGSHAGVSIGPDGPSQMGLEDIALFRAMHGSVVLYPADAIATERLVELALGHCGIVYIRTTRNPTPIIYRADSPFSIGALSVVRRDARDVVTVAGAGVTLHEALAAWEILRTRGIHIRVVDLYSIQPLPGPLLCEAADGTAAILTVEDHYPAGGIGEAIRGALGPRQVPVYSCFVGRMPRSGTTAELLDYEGISRDAIVRTVTRILENRPPGASVAQAGRP